jgi:hypothetical protein
MADKREVVEFRIFPTYGKCGIIKEVQRGNKVRFFAVNMAAQVVAEAPTQELLEKKLLEG